MALQSIAAHELVPVCSAVDATWRALQRGEPWSEPVALEGATFLVWRQPDLHVHHRRLAEDELALWPGLAAGMSFVGLCEQLLAQHEPEAAARRATELVASWARTGLLAG